MNLITADDLFSHTQPLRVGEVLALLDKYGFDSRRTGNAHIFYQNREWPDIHGTLANDGDHIKIRFQKIAAKDCLKAEKRQRQKDNKIQLDFQKASENRLAAIREKIPSHITADIAPNGLIILRDRNIPQIGITLYSAEEDRLIENKIHNEIEPLKREVYIALNRLRMEHDALPGFDHGTFTGVISHEVYASLPRLAIPDYTAGASAADILGTLADYRKQIEEKDLEHAIAREELLSKPFIRDVFVAYSSKRGERSNYVHIEGTRDSSLNFVFHTYSNQRAAGDGSRARISEDDLKGLSGKVARVEKYFARQAAPLERHVA